MMNRAIVFHSKSDNLLKDLEKPLDFTVYDGFWVDEWLVTTIKLEPENSQRLPFYKEKKKKQMPHSSWTDRLRCTKKILEKLCCFPILCDSTVATEALSPISWNDEPWHGFEAQSPLLHPSKRYSLISDIGDGSKSYTSKLIEHFKPLRPNGCHLNVSYFADKNRRAYMEDRLHISVINVAEPGINNRSKEIATVSTPISLFTIFDGHGGADASQFCCDWISSYLHYYWTIKDTIGSSFRSTFHTMDADFQLSGFNCGTTACSCIVVGKKYIVCANVGDSRAIVIQENGDVVALSHDHRPSVPEETKRITKLGGAVIYTDVWRVQGKLAVSRAIGDYHLKPFVTSDPDITEYQIQSKDRYLAIGSDGIYDVFDNVELAKIVIDYTGKYSVMHLAQFICNQAKALGTTDNVSLAIVDLCE